MFDPASTTPQPPRKLGDHGLSLWQSIQSEYRIDDAAGRELLTLICEASDRIAALGAKIEVPTIDGRALLKVPPGTQSGQKLRLREKGVLSATKEGVRGDEIVEITVTVPMPRDEKTKELLRELAKLNPEDPRAELFKNV